MSETPDINELLGRPADGVPRRMLVAGLGGGGCNAVDGMAEAWTDGPDCVLLDTDEQALGTCKTSRRLQLGKNLTQGAGAGSDPVVGRLAVEDDLDLLRGLLRDVDLLILVVGLGGGTGTGGAPVVARTAKEVGTMVLCVATLPFSFEGDGRRHYARAGLRDLRMPADAVVVQPNDRLLDITPSDEALVEAFSAADRMLATGVRALWRMLVKPGVINVTFADLSQLIEYAAGTCTFGFGEGQGPGSADAALRELLGNPLLEKGSQLTRAAALLVCITAGPELKLSDVQRIMGEINGLACAGVHTLLGVTLDEAWAERTAITVWAAEEWRLPEVETAEDLAEGQGLAAAARTEHAGEKSSGVQGQLNLGDVDKGRFRDVEPTLYEGQDLDVPTFIRKGVKLALHRQ